MRKFKQSDLAGQLRVLEANITRLKKNAAETRRNEDKATFGRAIANQEIERELVRGLLEAKQ